MAFAYSFSRSRAETLADAARSAGRHPALADALDCGRLNVDRAAAVGRRFESEGVDEPGDDVVSEAVKKAASSTVADLERAARRARRESREEAFSRHQRSSVTVLHNPETGMSRLSGLFPAVDGEAIEVALRRRALQMPDNPETSRPYPFDQRMAFALREICGLPSEPTPTPTARPSSFI